MTLSDVVEIVSGLEAAGVTVWVDGGWCVDALVGRQVRDHEDLDIAVRLSDEPALKTWFVEHGFIAWPSVDESSWNYVVCDAAGRRVDVHIFSFDAEGKNNYGVAYPHESLSGQAVLGGMTIHCIPADWQFQFKTSFKPRLRDLLDVQALAETYGFSIPASHQMTEF